MRELDCPELGDTAEIAARMMAWVAEPGLVGGSVSPQRSEQVVRQIAARATALAYASGLTGDSSCVMLARNLQMSRRGFVNYTGEARRRFGLRNPYFSAHAWNFGRPQA